MAIVIRKSLRERLQKRWGTGIPICPAPHTPRPTGSTLYKRESAYPFYDQRDTSGFGKPRFTPPEQEPFDWVPTRVMHRSGWAINQNRDENGRLESWT